MAPGLGLIFDCCLSPKSRPVFLVLLLLDAASVACFSVIEISKGSLTILTIIHSIFGLAFTAFSFAWMTLNHEVLLRIAAQSNLYMTGHGIDRSPSQYLSEWYVGFVAMIVRFVWFCFFKGNSIRNLCMIVFFNFPLLSAHLFSGQLSCLLNFVRSFYSDLLISKKYEDSVAKSHSLSKILDDIRQLYNVPIFLTISWLFLLFLLYAYGLFIPEQYSLTFGLIVFCISGIINVISPVILVIRSCNGLRRQVDKFNDYLYWQIVEDKSGQLLISERLDLHLTVKEEMAFTICDFFSIDNSLICSMVSTATTYLVIMLQYDHDKSSHRGVGMNTTIGTA